MQRYLLNFAYLGTRYNGMAQTKNMVQQVSVESRLVDAIKLLKPTNDVDLCVSSRTDAGVHALNTTAHIDLERKGNKPYLPHDLTKRINRKLEEWNEPIRILKTTPVNNTFCSRRFARNRTYLYRFAVAKTQSPENVTEKRFRTEAFVPIEEMQRCCFMPNRNFDIERMRAAAQQLEGYHDFRSFMKISGEQRTTHPRFCIRSIPSIKIKPGNTIVTCTNYDRTLSEYDFWDIEFKSRAYFYRQIRNMVGVLFCAADGRITRRDIYEMLTIPSKHTWNPRAHPAPAQGLYLACVEYDDDELQSMTVDLSNCKNVDVNTNE